MFNRFFLLLGVILVCSACSSPTEIARRNNLENRLEVAHRRKAHLQRELDDLNVRLKKAKEKTPAERVRDEYETLKIQSRSAGEPTTIGEIWDVMRRH